MAFSLGLSLRLSFKFGREFLIVEEGPRVVEFAIPRSFQILHRLNHALELAVPDK
jgi:hypothetical protein